MAAAQVARHQALEPPACGWAERLAAEQDISLKAARQAFLEAVDFVAAGSKGNPNAVFAGSVPYLMLAGNLVAGWQMARALMVAEDQLAAGNAPEFMRAKIATARFYADHILSRSSGQRDSIVDGAAGVSAMALDAF